jgi:hypothetical protein
MSIRRCRGRQANAPGPPDAPARKSPAEAGQWRLGSPNEKSYSDDPVRAPNSVSFWASADLSLVKHLLEQALLRHCLKEVTREFIDSCASRS